VKGQHASFDNIRKIIEVLDNAGTLEVAIGGGEPTSHPDFPHIIEMLSSNRITPNFTTKTLRWLKKPWAMEVLEKIGAFAFSVDNEAQALDATKEFYNFLISEIPYKGPMDPSLGYTPEYFENYDQAQKIKKLMEKMVFQHVFGVASKIETANLIRSVTNSQLGQRHKYLSDLGITLYDPRVTLLGYKQVGRGPKFNKFDTTGWLEEFYEDSVITLLSVDTALIQQNEEFFKQFNRSYFTKVEGSYSMYIDAVTGTMAPSSYADKSHYTPLDYNNLKEHILTTFETYPSEE
jgi:organic radical activating enzyme